MSVPYDSITTIKLNKENPSEPLSLPNKSRNRVSVANKSK